MGSTAENNVIEPIAVPYARRHGNDSSFKTRKLEPIVQVLSKITCSFAESRLSHGQRIPQTRLQLITYETSSVDVSDTASQATGHQRARRCSPVGMAPALLAIETSEKLMY